MKNWPTSGVSGREIQQARDAKVAGEMLIEDRILIHKRMHASRVADRWMELTGEKEMTKVLIKWTDLHSALINNARADLGLED